MISFGIDIGTTTLRATAVEISPRNETQNIVGTALCTYTPYGDDGDLDESQIFLQLTQWAKAQPVPAPDLGTLLFTGEAQRTKNCGRVGERVNAHWSGLMSVQLNPELETILAAHGAGAVALSATQLGRPVLHLDIGGGTTNLAWIENGKITDTACLDLGARKWIFDPKTLKIKKRTQAALSLEILYPEILRNRESFDLNSATHFAQILATLLLASDSRFENFFVCPWQSKKEVAPKTILSFSGGVADCMKEPSAAPFIFGDLGPLLSQALLQRCQGRDFHCSPESGRATALGVSRFGFSLSGCSLHLSDHFATIREQKNIPLLTPAQFEAQFEAWAFTTETVAIHLPQLPWGRLELEQAAKEWAGKLLLQKKSTRSIVFLLSENLAKSFGYFLTKYLTGHSFPILVLDEFSPVASLESSLVRCVDIKRLSAEDRFAIVVKAIRVF